MRVADVGECYEKHSAQLLRFAATVVGPVDAEDVVGTAVTRVLAADLSAVENLRSYLYRAVLNAGRQHLRSLHRRERRELLAAISDLVAPEEFENDMRAALAHLSAQQRAVIHLAYWEDLAPDVIANRIGVSDGTVRKQLARARKKLSEVVANDI